MGRANAAQVFGETSTGPGMKSLSWDMKRKRPTSNVQRPTSKLRKGRAMLVALIGPLILLYEANIAAAFEKRGLDLGEVFRFGVEVEIFLKIVLRDQTSLHFLPVDFSIPHQSVGTAFDELAKGVRLESAE